MLLVLICDRLEFQCFIVKGVFYTQLKTRAEKIDFVRHLECFFFSFFCLIWRIVLVKKKIVFVAMHFSVLVEVNKFIKCCSLSIICLFQDHCMRQLQCANGVFSPVKLLFRARKMNKISKMNYMILEWFFILQTHLMRCFTNVN